MAYVYSTLPAAMNFNGVVIKGGAGVANSRTLITPRGVATSVTEEQLAMLEGHRVFADYVKRGLFSTSKLEKDADKVAKDMNKDAKGKQETPETLKTPTKKKS